MEFCTNQIYLFLSLLAASSNMGTPGSVPGKRTPFFCLRRLQWRSWTLCFYTVSWPGLFHTYIAVNTIPLSTFTTQIVVDLGDPVCLVKWFSTYHMVHPSEIDLSRGAFVTCMGSTALNISSHATPYQLVPGSWGLASNRSSLLADSSVLFQILVSCQKTNAGTPWLDENPCKEWHLHPFSVV